MSNLLSEDAGKPSGAPGWFRRLAANLGFSTSASLRETLERAIAEAEAEGGSPLSLQERAMLLNILNFGGLKVSEVMIPRADIVAIAEDETISDLLRLFSEAEHSRIPVYRESLDDPIGMVHIKDAMKWATGNASVPGDERLNFGLLNLEKTIVEAKLTREVLFVPPSMPAVDLHARMRAKQIHLAVVVDEFGGTDGLVSFEDLVEEIIGEIADEHDTDEQPKIDVEGETCVASARVPVEKVEKVLGVSLTLPNGMHDVHTLGGLILALVGRVPKRGSLISHPSGLLFEVLEATPRRVTKVKISRLHQIEASKPPLLLPPSDGRVANGRERRDGPQGARAA
jgi:CBS domain containing-hemolysin-like protein